MKRCDFFERMLVTFGIFGAIAMFVESTTHDSDAYDVEVQCQKNQVWCESKQRCMALDGSELCNILEQISTDEENPIGKDNPIENSNPLSEGKSMISVSNKLQVLEKIKEVEKTVAEVKSWLEENN